MEEKKIKRRILIVDDIIGNIKILIEILKPYYEISFVTNGSEALETAKLEHPDLVLLDIMMPDMDGFEVCGQFKIDPQLAEIPIIFLTALEESESIVKGFDLGAVDYVTKPYHPAELKTRIENHLKLKESREIIAQKNKELAELFQILCHDFMTPISYAIGSLELIRDNRHLFDTFEPDISKSLNNAIDLIELVRTLRKLDDLNETFELSPIMLHDAIEKALAMMQHSLKEKNIISKVNVSNTHIILAEETSLINSVVNNLLTNAIKFSYEDSTLEVSSFEKDDRVVLEIKDYGMGMSDALLEDLFVVTRATSRKGTSGEKGTGYGMLLIKKFIDLYEAKISVSSKSEREHKDEHGTIVKVSFAKA